MAQMAQANIKIHRQPKNMFDILNGYDNYEKLSIREYNMEIEHYRALELLNNDIFANRIVNHKEKTRFNRLDKSVNGTTSYINNGWRDKYRNIAGYISYHQGQTVRDKLPGDFDAVKRLWNSRPYKSADYNWNEFMNELFTLYEITPEVHKYMLNICPNWKGNVKGRMMELLEKVVKSYLEESDRWVNAVYTLENGSDGDNLHVHIVATPNHKLIKSIDSHIANGNHKQQLVKYWKKYCKSVPNLQGHSTALDSIHSVQRVILRTSEMQQDKLDYLIEDKKPIGHKNKVLDKDKLELNPIYERLNKPNEWFSQTLN